jgi:hypothetical protein
MNLLLAASLSHYGWRLGIVAAALAIWFWTQSLIGAKAPVGGGGLGDALHGLTAGWHRYLLAHPRVADRILIVSSLCNDLFGVSLIGLAVFGPTMAPFVAVIVLFALRQLCQMVCTLPPPPGIIWRYPGFPSLLVTYGVSNDFFFSGHTALAVLGALEVCHLAPGWLAGIACAVAALEAVVVLVLRAHYTLDVIAGALAAWFAFDVSGPLTHTVSAYLAG